MKRGSRFFFLLQKNKTNFERGIIVKLSVYYLSSAGRRETNDNKVSTVAKIRKKEAKTLRVTLYESPYEKCPKRQGI